MNILNTAVLCDLVTGKCNVFAKDKREKVHKLPAKNEDS